MRLSCIKEVKYNINKTYVHVYGSMEVIFYLKFYLICLYNFDN